jgi:hypothetical protein
MECPTCHIAVARSVTNNTTARNDNCQGTISKQDSVLSNPSLLLAQNKPNPIFQEIKTDEANNPKLDIAEDDAENKSGKKANSKEDPKEPIPHQPNCKYNITELPEKLYRVIVWNSETFYDEAKGLDSRNGVSAPGDIRELIHSLVHHFAWQAQVHSCWISLFGSWKHALAWANATTKRHPYHQTHYWKYIIVEIDRDCLIEQKCLVLKADRLIELFKLNVARPGAYFDEHLVLHKISFEGIKEIPVFEFTLAQQTGTSARLPIINGKEPIRIIRRAQGEATEPQMEEDPSDLTPTRTKEVCRLKRKRHDTEVGENGFAIDQEDQNGTACE